MAFAALEVGLSCDDTPFDKDNIYAGFMWTFAMGTVKVNERPDARSVYSVAASVVPLVHVVRERSGWPYASMPWSPLSDAALVHVANLFDGTLLCTTRLNSDASEIALPGTFGPPLLAVNDELPPAEKSLAIRHGLGHIVAGDIRRSRTGGQLRLLSNRQDWTTLEERRADLFALADLIPNGMLEERAGEFGRTSMQLIQWLGTSLRRYAPGWPEERIADRLALRLALWKDRRDL